MKQFKNVLIDLDVKFAEFDAAIAALDGAEGNAARIEWEFATEVRRDSPLVTILATALELSEEQLDALFIQAAKL